jgi:hypothetical protein
MKTTIIITHNLAAKKLGHSLQKGTIRIRKSTVEQLLCAFSAFCGQTTCYSGNRNSNYIGHGFSWVASPTVIFCADTVKWMVIGFSPMASNASVIETR